MGKSVGIARTRPVFVKSYDRGNRISLPLEMDGNEGQKRLESVNRSKDENTQGSNELESHSHL